ncbi:MAG: hypothetical protein ACXVLM_10745, partial [Ilumatobacteraceae bacterium]
VVPAAGAVVAAAGGVVAAAGAVVAAAGGVVAAAGGVVAAAGGVVAVDAFLELPQLAATSAAARSTTLSVRRRECRVIDTW